MNFKFWFKTLLHFIVPGGFGYDRVLRQNFDPSYVQARDKHPVREKHHGKGGWKEQRDQEGIKKRDYTNYDEYVVHQKQKFDEIIKAKGGFSAMDITGYRLKFYQRFKKLSSLLPRNAIMLCAGARQGTEVEVLRDLGFKNAYGIDLNPGPNNPYVKKGDFMHLEEKNDSIDFFYTNCVDHAFDLEAFFAEHARVLKPTGYALYDLSIVDEEGGGAFEAVSWKRTEDIAVHLLQKFGRLISARREKQWLCLLIKGKNVRAKTL